MPANFDPIARWYGLLEVLAFGNALQRCRTALLDEVRSARRILIAGEGNGRFLKALLRGNPAAQVTVVDSSRRMLELARNRVQADPRVHFVHGDLLDEAVALPASDAVVTNFFLDCFSDGELNGVFSRLRAALIPGGTWLWADFAIPARGLMHRVAGATTRLLYDFFRLTSHISADHLIDPATRFARQDLAIVRSIVLLGGMLAAASFRSGS